MELEDRPRKTKVKWKKKKKNKLIVPCFCLSEYDKLRSRSVNPISHPQNSAILVLPATKLCRRSVRAPIRKKVNPQKRSLNPACAVARQPTKDHPKPQEADNPLLHLLGEKIEE